MAINILTQGATKGISYIQKRKEEIKMFDLYEALEALSKVDANDNKLVLNINVQIENYLNEGLPSGERNANYDDQVIEDWNNFIGNIEEIIEVENGYSLEDIFSSNKGNKLSTYFNFLLPNNQECIINLRVSDHASSGYIKANRKSHVQDYIKEHGLLNYKLYGVTVNDKLYTSYDDALNAIRDLISKIK